MSYVAYVTRLKNLRKHSNADKLNVGECFGNTVVVDLSYTENQLGIYFPTDGQLSAEFAEANNLLRKKDDLGNNIGGYLEPEKRNIRTIKLRGENSDGLFLPLESLSMFGDISILKDGDSIDTFNGHLICEKYIPKKSSFKGCGTGSKTRKTKKKEFPLFVEHIDTEQLAYNLHQFKKGDICTLTLKLHGTSARTGYLPRIVEKPQNFVQKLLKRPIEYDKVWDYVSGTRRTILDCENLNGGFYNDDTFRKEWHDFIAHKLRKGEEIFYEIVGYCNTSTLIMGECSNKKVNDKEFLKQYGDTTKFTYGCGVGENKAFVYRMTMTNEDGDIIEYPTWYARLRAEQMGLEFVPILEQFVFTTKDSLIKKVEKHYDGVDPIGKTHIREGVVVRIENKEKMKAFKHKNTYFKILEGIIKDEAIMPDIEEAEECI